MDSSSIIENVTKLVEVTALVLGGGYFLWRAISGELLPSLSLTLTTHRLSVPDDPTIERIQIKVDIEKSERGSINLLLLACRAADLGGNLLCEARADVARLATTECEIQSWQPDSKRTFLNLNGGDVCSFEKVLTVPASAEAQIDVVLLGREVDFIKIRRPKVSQWRSSCFVPRMASARSDG